MFGSGARPSEPVPDTLGLHDPIDVNAEGTRLGLWVYVLILFLISTCFAWAELRYIVRGKSAEAEALRTYQVTGRNGYVTHYVEYEYRDAAGQTVKDSDSISADWQTPSSGRVKVTYLSGELQTSRLAGHRHYIAVTFFAICVAALLFVGIKWWREGDKVAQYLSREDD